MFWLRLISTLILKRVKKMKKNELWNKFLKTGRVQDYLAYAKSQNLSNIDLYETEIAQEIHIENLDLGEDVYDN